VTARTISGVTFEGVAFDSRDFRLVVADQANGPGSLYADAGAAARARGGVAAINAGFFTPEGAPLGLVVSSGKTSGAWNSSSSLGSGVWSRNASGSDNISRREKLGRNGAASMRELIQAGPMLVENGRAVGGLEATKVSARAMILWDGGTRWWIGISSPCTLAALAQALADGEPAGWPVRQALNLDGGRSTDLWISGAIAGGPVNRRPPWNRPVRNFLVLVAN
jgi:exopolysaccharide biosynthesis protein